MAFGIFTIQIPNVLIIKQFFSLPQESKNCNLHSIIGKHEETIGKLHSYLMENNSKLSLSERSQVKSEMEIKRLKNVEIR